MKILRIILSTILLLVFVGIIGIGSLYFFVDPNKLKPIITAEVKERTGYGIQIEGKLSWSFYPHIGVKVDRITLYSPKQTNPFMDLSNVVFITEFKELLHGRQALRGDVYISALTLANAHITKAHVGLNWKDKILTLSPIKADFYAGEVSGVARGRELAALPRWDWNLQFKGVSVKPLLQDIVSAENKVNIGGSANLTFQAQSEGKTQEQILNNLNGAFVYSLSNGVLEGVDLNYFVRSADAIIRKQPLNAPTRLDQTQFDSLVGAATIHNGVAEINAFTLTSPTFITRAHGTVNLPYQAINLQLQITEQKEIKTHIAIPVMLTGSLSRPDIRLDLTELNVMITKNDIDSVKTKLHKEVNRHLSPESAKMLDSLLGQ